MEKKVELVNGCFYHVYNRGVDKREVYQDKQDFYRAVDSIHDFNSAQNVRIRVARKKSQPITRIREFLVDIICFIFIPNHYHMILRQLVDDGISKFMQKFGTGYIMYFNEKNKRTGRLFEAKYKSKLIETDEYLMHLSRYIHLNCLDLIEPEWREKGVNDWDRANKFLESYKWSSYLDYVGIYNFPHIINKGPISEYFKTPEAYKKYLQTWMVKDMDILEERELIIE